MSLLREWGAENSWHCMPNRRSFRDCLWLIGLGVLSKLLEGWAGAVLAKIAVLLFIVVFIQKRPQGIFALKGRSAEA